MNIFEQHAIAQVHFNKTAGTSLKAYLSEVLKEDAQIVHGKHNALTDVYHLLPEAYRVVTTIRNPYDRLVSLYSFRKKRFLSGERGRPEERLRNAHELGFKEWFFKDLMPHCRAGNQMDQPISRLLLIDGEVPSNVFVFKLEKLQSEIDSFLLNMQIKAELRLPNLNRSERANYLAYYDEELLEVVYEWDRHIFDNYYPDLVLL